MLIDNGRIEQTGQLATQIKDAVNIDLKGMYVYPSFIELYSQYGLPEPVKSPRLRARSMNPPKREPITGMKLFGLRQKLISYLSVIQSRLNLSWAMALVRYSPIIWMASPGGREPWYCSAMTIHTGKCLCPVHPSIFLSEKVPPPNPLPPRLWVP